MPAKKLEDKYKSSENYERILECYGKSFAEKLFNFENKSYEGKDCEKCLIFKTTFHVKNGYKKYCTKCSHSAPGVLEKRKESCFKKYGVDNISKSQHFLKKSKETFIENYGVDNPNKVPEIREKIKKTIQEKIGTESYFHLPDFQKRIKEIIKEKHGSEFSMQTEKGKKKFLDTCIERFGVSYTASDENREKLREKEVQEKANLGREKTCKEKYGVSHISQVVSVKEKVRNTLLEKYGVSNSMNIPEIVEKNKKKYLEKFGVEWACLIKTNYKTSKFERKLRELFNLEPFKLKTKQFDLCFEDDKILLEADGEFWHKENIRKINNQQFYNFINDYKKEILAKENGYVLKRIKISQIEKLFKEKLEITKELILDNCYEKIYDFSIPLNEIILKDYLEILFLTNKEDRMKVLFKTMQQYFFISTGKNFTIEQILKENYGIYNS